MAVADSQQDNLAASAWIIEDTGYDGFYRQMDITIIACGQREIQDLQDVERFLSSYENYVFAW